MALTHPGGIVAIRDNYQTLAMTRLFKFTRRDTSVLRYTTHDRVVEFDGETYTPVGGVNGEAMRAEAGGDAGRFSFTFPVDGEEWMTEDLRTRMWAEAEVWVYDVDWRWPFLGAWRSRWGILQDVEFSGVVGKAEVRSITDSLNRKVGATTSRVCRYVLGVNTGHSFCAADVVAAGKWTGTVLASAGFSGSNKRRVFRVELIGGFGQKPSQWYRDGDLTWWTGDNADIVADPSGTPVDGVNRFVVKRYTNVTTSPSGSYVDQIELQDDTHLDIAIGDTFEVTPGCLKRFGKDCGPTKYDVQDGFGGEPYMPAADKVINGKVV